MNLIPTNQIISQATKEGYDFSGEPKVHLVYLTKLGLLPSAVKRKIDGSLTGCYPDWTIDRLLEIQKLRSEGLTFTQIRHILSNSSTLQLFESPTPRLSSSPTPSLLFLFLGVILGFFLAANLYGKPAALPFSPVDKIPQKLLTSSGAEKIYPVGQNYDNFGTVGRTDINNLNNYPEQ